jgi:hypothetical protein
MMEEVNSTMIYCNCFANWLTPVIPATQKAEIRKTVIQSEPSKQFERPILKKTHHKKRAGGVTQGVSHEFKPQYRKKKFFFVNVTMYPQDNKF